MFIEASMAFSTNSPHDSHQVFLIHIDHYVRYCGIQQVLVTVRLLIGLPLNVTRVLMVQDFQIRKSRWRHARSDMTVKIIG